MKNLRVRTKLMVSFALVVLLTAAVGVVGAVGVSALSKADMAMYEYNVMGMDLLGSIRENYALQRMNYRNYIIYDPDSDYFKNAAAKMDALEASMETYIEAYLPTVVEQEDLDWFNKFCADYRGGFKDLKIQMKALGQSREREQALTILAEPDIIQLSNTIDESMGECYRLNVKYAHSAVSSNSALAGKIIAIQIAALAAVFSVSVFLTIYVSGIISKPMSLLTQFMQNAGITGDITLRPEDVENIEKCSKARDEIGECIGSCARFVGRLQEVNNSLVTVADGDLTCELKLLSDKDTMGLSLKKMTGNLNKMFGEIKNATIQVAAGSKQVSDGSQTLAQGSTEQAAAVEELSCSISGIAKKTDENANMAEHASRLAQTIKHNAEKGSMQMEQMLEAVKEIQEASRSIGKVIKVIDDIAFQTNILALNAAVEAARAGQHGKGFAVVAEEVRNLAAKSAAAAKDTGSLIANSMEKSEMGARIAAETAESLSEIVTGIDESGRIVADIARSSGEQATAIAQINGGIEQVAHVVQQNSATAQESAAAAEEMNEQSYMLESFVQRFKVKDGDYSHPNAKNSPISMAAKTSKPSPITDDMRKY